ncbi:hypothetical protein VP01_1354g1 [Puccinia sorghi]|uniref:Uncharacterized protein n=1 Tax=Puccinia sorghi TaxID=27349 RepID=A0A0L6VNQ3_9BASI|nr:hypothetical protein VP01_1354g1 [Puccinia sorghi]
MLKCPIQDKFDKKRMDEKKQQFCENLFGHESQNSNNTQNPLHDYSAISILLCLLKSRGTIQVRITLHLVEYFHMLLPTAHSHNITVKVAFITRFASGIPCPGCVMENDPYQISNLVLLQSTSLIFFFYFFYLSLLLISNGDSLMRPEDCQIGSKHSLKVFLWRRTQQICACVTMARDHGTVTMSTMGFALGTNHPIIDSTSIHHSLPLPHFLRFVTQIYMCFLIFFSRDHVKGGMKFCDGGYWNVPHTHLKLEEIELWLDFPVNAHSITLDFLWMLISTLNIHPTGGLARKVAQLEYKLISRTYEGTQYLIMIAILWRCRSHKHKDTMPMAIVALWGNSSSGLESIFLQPGLTSSVRGCDVGSWLIPIQSLTNQSFPQLKKMINPQSCEAEKYQSLGETSAGLITSKGEFDRDDLNDDIQFTLFFQFSVLSSCVNTQSLIPGQPIQRITGFQALECKWNHFMLLNYLREDGLKYSPLDWSREFPQKILVIIWDAENIDWRGYSSCFCSLFRFELSFDGTDNLKNLKWFSLHPIILIPPENFLVFNFKSQEVVYSSKLSMKIYF